GVDARAQRKTQVESTGQSRFAPGDGKEGAQSGLHPSAAHLLQALRHQQTVVGVQLDDIGDGAQCDQIGQLIQPRSAVRRIDAALAKLCPQCQHQVKNNAHASQVLGGKPTACLVGVDDGQGAGQHLARQVVVGNQYVDAGRVCGLYAIHAGNAVVHRNQ